MSGFRSVPYRKPNGSWAPRDSLLLGGSQAASEEQTTAVLGCLLPRMISGITSCGLSAGRGVCSIVQNKYLNLSCSLHFSITCGSPVHTASSHLLPPSRPSRRLSFPLCSHQEPSGWASLRESRWQEAGTCQ